MSTDVLKVYRFNYVSVKILSRIFSYKFKCNFSHGSHNAVYYPSLRNIKRSGFIRKCDYQFKIIFDNCYAMKICENVKIFIKDSIKFQTDYKSPLI